MPKKFSQATARRAPDEASDDDRPMDQSPVPAHVHPRSPWQREAGALPSHGLLMFLSQIILMLLVASTDVVVVGGGLNSSG